MHNFQNSKCSVYARHVLPDWTDDVPEDESDGDDDLVSFLTKVNVMTSAVDWG